MRRFRGEGPRLPNLDLRAAVAPALVATGLALPLLLASLPASPASATSTMTAPTPRVQGIRAHDITAASHGLVITLSVVPARAAPGTSVELYLSLAARAANGALGYVVRFGDGTRRANAIPMYCLAGPGRPEHETWRLAHRYARAGTYYISATGYANCGPDRVSVTSRVVIT
jgi:hypothetical protein